MAEAQETDTLVLVGDALEGAGRVTQRQGKATAMQSQLQQRVSTEAVVCSSAGGGLVGGAMLYACLTLATCGVALSGCDGMADNNRAATASHDEPIVRTVTPVVVRDGDTEIATLGQLPHLLDEDYRWSIELRHEFHGTDPVEPLVLDPRASTVLGDSLLILHDPASDTALSAITLASSELFRFGRSGRGPGELGPVIALGAIPGGGFAAFDVVNRRVERFDATLQQLGGVPVELPTMSGKALPSPGRRSFFVESLLVTGQTDWTREAVEVDAISGAVGVRVPLPVPGPGVRIGTLQEGRTLWTIVGETLVSMSSDKPQVLVHDLMGRHVRTIVLPLGRREVTSAELNRLRDAHGGIANRIDTGPIALTNELYPVNDSVFAIYVSDLWRSAQDPELPPRETWWRLFTTRGAFLGAVNVPEGFRPLSAGGGMWARLVDHVGFPVVAEVVLRPAEGGP